MLRSVLSQVIALTALAVNALASAQGEVIYKRYDYLYSNSSSSSLTSSISQTTVSYLPSSSSSASSHGSPESSVVTLQSSSIASASSSSSSRSSSSSATSLPSPYIEGLYTTEHALEWSIYIPQSGYDLTEVGVVTNYTDGYEFETSPVVYTGDTADWTTSSSDNYVDTFTSGSSAVYIFDFDDSEYIKVDITAAIEDFDLDSYVGTYNVTIIGIFDGYSQALKFTLSYEITNLFPVIVSSLSSAYESSKSLSSSSSSIISSVPVSTSESSIAPSSTPTLSSSTSSSISQTYSSGFLFSFSPTGSPSSSSSSITSSPSGSLSLEVSTIYSTYTTTTIPKLQISLNGGQNSNDSVTVPDFSFDLSDNPDFIIGAVNLRARTQQNHYYLSESGVEGTLDSEDILIESSSSNGVMDYMYDDRPEGYDGSEDLLIEIDGTTEEDDPATGYSITLTATVWYSAKSGVIEISTVTTAVGTTTIGLAKRADSSTREFTSTVVVLVATTGQSSSLASSSATGSASSKFASSSSSSSSVVSTITSISSYLTSSGSSTFST
ncbi:hypothetical protein CANARDRAFT_8571, partial [[Candida] arabinofermentans NRRL YB-2248]